ncbi:acetyl-CoA carboxylase biotin carboxylase subunit family protein [Actinokineospora soli]|uniref:Acetyl-CoA carboxylase biotin carboxylase subunit family protein n=1 Tax=Actinokineospora soli TaxID=1048753 RepID=A0ABW2TQ43_9PSEU
MRPITVFVLGLDELNLELLRQVPDADRYEFHGLLTIERLQVGDIPVDDLLDEACRVLDDFDGPIDAIVGYWDFPVSTMLPILQRRYGVRGAPLEAVLKCEHKYWSRLVQSQVIDEYPPFALVEPDQPDPPAGVDFPFWLKPVKSFSSDLAFEVTDLAGFTAAREEIAAGIDRVGEPFERLLTRADLPAEIAEVGGQVCLAEAALSGARAAVEGYCVDGKAEVYGVLDSLVYDGVSSFLRHQYPSRLPQSTQDKLKQVAITAIEHIGLSPATFSVEFFCDPETDRVWLLEINPRHSQAHAEPFLHVDGVPNHHRMLAVALGEDPAVQPGGGEHGISAIWYLRHFTDGVLTGTLDGDLEPGVRVHWRAKPGSGSPAATATATCWPRSPWAPPTKRT